MEHPFLSSASLADKSLDDLQTAMSGLTSKLTFAYRTGNQNLVNQINMVMESYRAQYNMRMDAMLNKQMTKSSISIQKD